MRSPSAAYAHKVLAYQKRNPLAQLLHWDQEMCVWMLSYSDHHKENCLA